MKRLRLLVTSLAIAGVWMVTATNAQAPQPPPDRIVTDTVPRRKPTVTTTTVTTLPPARHAECAKWLGLALRAGWKREVLPELERVLWKESRCLPHVHNATDPNGGSHGLAQVNGFWCRPSRYYPDGYLQTKRILTTCDELYAPLINLRAALAIYDYAKGWSQWGL